MKFKSHFCIILCFILLLLSTTISFATNDMDKVNKDINNAINSEKEMLRNSGNAIKDSSKMLETKTKNGIENIKKDSEKSADKIKNETNTIKNNIDNTLNNNSNIEKNEIYEENKNYDNYAVTRTSTGTNLDNNMFSNVWTWLIIAVIAIVVIALIMYYARQSNVTTYNPDNDKTNN